MKYINIMNYSKFSINYVIIKIILIYYFSYIIRYFTLLIGKIYLYNKKNTYKIR